MRTDSPMSPLEWLDSLQGSGIRPGLARMRTLLRALGGPHREVPAILVAGTNGKGSTSAMLASILTAAGYRAAHYTSPHLVELRERWTVDGEMIPADLLDQSIVTLQGAAAKSGITPTYFEALTLIAFIAFARSKCDVSVLEVGMGGRLDATNVVGPMASVITPVGFDHMEYLGTTLTQIAREKAGIIHRGSVVVTSNRDPAVLPVLRRRAARFGCRFVVTRADDRQRIPAAVPLAGPFQWENAALAIRTAEELTDRLPAITPEAIVRGIETTRWRGRLERITVGERTVWIDGCHNAHAAAAVAPFIERSVAAPRLLVFGIMSDKNVAEVLRILIPPFDRVITTEPFPPRSAPASELARDAESLGVPAIAIPSPEQAFEAALQSPARSVFVGGSLYLAGAAIAFFDRLAGRERIEKLKIEN